MQRTPRHVPRRRTRRSIGLVAAVCSAMLATASPPAVADGLLGTGLLGDDDPLLGEDSLLGGTLAGLPLLGDALYGGMWSDEPLAEGEVDMGTLRAVTQRIDAPKVWRDGITGNGIGVAVIDSGVIPVQGLTGTGKVVNGPDLSFESQIESLRYLDTFGHGTHMAAIIAGRDGAAGGSYTKAGRFVGVAPGAHLVSLKVASFEGATDVTQVIAAVDWVVEHRNDPGLNIRVLNLSFGTDGVQSYLVDPLAHAVEVAWRHGIVVVVSAGNSGYGTSTINDPAFDPYVLAVGAADLNKTTDTSDDVVAAFSSVGDASRRPDLLAPGRSIASLRAPGSYIDDMYPGARFEERFFRGSGTSQAAAVVSGAVALLLDQRPGMTPDQVKRLLTDTAEALPAVGSAGSGAGMLDVDAAQERARNVSALPGRQTWPRSTGTGSLEGARGSEHLADEGVELIGEFDIFGNLWNAPAWSQAAEAETTWQGGSWNGVELTGSSWTGSSWTARTWAGKSWAGKSWAGKSWASDDWAGKSWAGKSWAGKSWAGKSWAGKSWAGKSWAGNSWGARRGPRR